MGQINAWKSQEYQAAAACAPPFICTARANAAELQAYWQSRARSEQALLPGYDPVDVWFAGCRRGR